MLNEDIHKLDTAQFLRNKIASLKQQQKAIKDIIRDAEEELSIIENHHSRQKQVTENLVNESLSIGKELGIYDFSVKKWKPDVLQFLTINNPTTFTTDEILTGIDKDKKYILNDGLRKKAIQSISSSLFALIKKNKVSKYSNEGKRGHKYAYKNQNPPLKLAEG